MSDPGGVAYRTLAGQLSSTVRRTPVQRGEALQWDLPAERETSVRNLDLPLNVPFRGSDKLALMCKVYQHTRLLRDIGEVTGPEKSPVQT
jgi:hypothetical protein